jgi:predicted nucleic acid-binding protein
MTLVFDATPLIYLGKIDRLDVVADLDRSLVVPGRVDEEVVGEGMKREYADANRIDAAVRDGIIEQETFERNERFDKLVQNTPLSPADVAVILLADELGGTAVLDEDYGRTVAETEAVETRGTAYFVLSRVKDGELASEEAREIIDGMVDAGWYCSTDLYSKILRKLEAIAPE